MKDHFLDEGDFLVFNYDGKSRFDVTIYDKRACEMELEAAKTERSGNLAGGSSKLYYALLLTRLQPSFFFIC